MTAPQQSLNPTYKEKAGIPRSDVAYFTHSERDTPGMALSRLLNTVNDRGASLLPDEPSAEEKAHEDRVNMAHAQLGLERFNAAQSRGLLNFRSGDFDQDSYAAKQGQLAASSFSGSLRDKYMADGVYESADPNAFNTWLSENIASQVEEARAKGSSYYGGFISELGSAAELMGKQFAGHSEGVVQRNSQDAFKRRLQLARDADQYVSSSDDMGRWLKGFLAPESSGNWNAWFGNADNQEAITELTLGEILERQAKPGNDAAGLIQIVPGTLKAMMSKYGYDPETKFTPQVQTEMALLLMKEKGLDRWIKGHISDGAFADKLAGVWAGFKTSKGSGVYDSDGVNKATQGHDVTVRHLGELRSLLQSNPQLRQWVVTDGLMAGSTKDLLSTEPGSSRHQTAKLLADEASTGLSNEQMRSIFADSLSEEFASKSYEPEAVEREIRASNLNKEQADRVRAAAEEGRLVGEASARRELDGDVRKVSDYFISSDPSTLAEIKQRNPRVHRRILEIEAGNVEYDAERLQQTTEQFETETSPGSPEFPQEALKYLLNGRITKDSYTAALREHETVSKAQFIMQSPATKKIVAEVSGSLSPRERSMFDAQLPLILSDMSDALDGKRPPATEIMQAVTELRARLIASSEDIRSYVGTKQAYSLEN